MMTVVTLKERKCPYPQHHPTSSPSQRLRVFSRTVHAAFFPPGTDTGKIGWWAVIHRTRTFHPTPTLPFQAWLSVHLAFLYSWALVAMSRTFLISGQNCVVCNARGGGWWMEKKENSPNCTTTSPLPFSACQHAYPLHAPPQLFALPALLLPPASLPPPFPPVCPAFHIVMLVTLFQNKEHTPLAECCIKVPGMLKWVEQLIGRRNRAWDKVTGTGTGHAVLGLSFGGRDGTLPNQLLFCVLFSISG